ncbi:MAG: hypothetical protein ACR2OO_06090 [Thermomicrobiales bacterium]
MVDIGPEAGDDPALIEQPLTSEGHADVDDPAIPDPPLTAEEQAAFDADQARILAGAKAARTTVIAVAAVALGGILFMFVFTIVIVVLKTWG